MDLVKDSEEELPLVSAESRSPKTVVLFFCHSALLPSVGIVFTDFESLAVSSYVVGKRPPEAYAIIAHEPEEKFPSSAFVYVYTLLRSSLHQE